MIDTNFVNGDTASLNKGEIVPFFGQFKKWFLIAIGTICVGLGVAGIFLPLLPTTPFLLLAAACYAASSEKFYRWLLENRWFGRYIKNYREGKGLTITTKVVSLFSMWAMMGFSATFFVPWLAGKLVLLAVALGVTFHILSKPTCRL